MTIAECCNRNVVVATRDTTIEEAARLMRHHHVGDLVVVDPTAGERTPIGIVTDRDIVVEVVAAGLEPKAIKLADIIIGGLMAVEERESCANAVHLMALKGVRRMPVVNAAGGLVGIVTVDDLLPQLASQVSELSELAARSREREREIRK